MKFKTVVSILFIFILAFPQPSLLAWSGTQTELVVLPYHDGDQDDGSDEVVRQINSSLKYHNKIHLVESENVKSVLKYHNNKSTTPEISSIERILSNAKEQYYAFDYIEAKSLVNRAIEELDNLPAARYENGGLLLNSYLTLGIVYRSMGNVGEARQAFVKALRLDPDYKLDGRAFSPSFVALFEKARSSLNYGPKGGLRVVTKPKVADVYVDGIRRGVTPLTLEQISEGEHYLQISAHNYETVRRVVEIKKGGITKIREKLQWTAGREGGLEGADYVSGGDVNSIVDEGLKVASLFKVGKVAIVDADVSGVATVRVVDSKYGTGQKPVSIRVKDAARVSPDELDKIISVVISEVQKNPAANPRKIAEPLGKGNLTLTTQRRSRKISKPVLFGILGGVLAAGLGAGLAAAFAGGSSGGSSTPGTGSLAVQFK